MAIDSYRFLDFATRQIIRAWVDREAHDTRPIPWMPMTKPLAECTIVLVSTAGVARNDDQPFDQEGERRNRGGVIPLTAPSRRVRPRAR